MRIVFMGTPAFAVESLRALVEGGYNVVAVVTAPDKPAGRGQKLHQSDVKRYALQAGLPLLQPEKLREEQFLARLEALRPDLGIVIAFRMLPEAVWALPRLGTFNLHASLLPQYRGAAPINWALINGEEQTGVTTFMLDHNIDTGAILGRRSCPIEPSDDASTLHDRLMHMGRDLVLETVEGIAAGRIAPIDQTRYEPAQLKAAPKLFRDDCRIDWSAPARRIVDLIRGLSPHPGAWCALLREGEETSVKILSARCIPGPAHAAPGSVATDGKSYLRVACGEGEVELGELQPAGKRRMGVREFLAGVRNPAACSLR